MKEGNPESFLFQKLDSSVAKYKSESKRLKHWTFGIRIIVLLLAALSTVLLGWNPKDNPEYTIWSRNVALTLGALSTFIIGISTFWNVENYCLKQKVLFARVRALRERCTFLKSKDELSEEEIDSAFNEYRAMMDDRIEYWEKIALKNTPKKDAASGASS